ncbi:LytR family transcriptional regulator [Scytonema sp. UIC 10036]|uniref:LCP family glycopolymer transferase n=1 Tax=Scytonema sp. UIC 10036 TaxID=2304196 RepID=UPI001380E877|nr:LytR family transcriptional regulator [Scytonema sp. UIC 10036]
MTSKKPLVAENDYGETSNNARWMWLWLGMGAIALTSATLGGLLAVSMTSTPLMQTKLTSKESEVFESDRLTGEGLKFSELSRPVNILVLGMSVLPTDVQDSKAKAKNRGYLPQVNSFSGLSDVMLLVRLNPEEKKIVILSVPRDTRVSLEGHGVVKINAANVVGGPALSAKTISELLGGVEIDRYIRINVLGVNKLIDALGGVTVDVPYDMKYRDDSQHLYINLKKGKQHLDGDKTLQMLRYRNDGRGDIGRVERQQIVMRALAEQTLNPTLLARFPRILNVVRSHLDTNLTVEEILTLVNFGVQTGNSNMETLTLPGRASAYHEYKTSYWIPNAQQIEKMAIDYFNLQVMNPPQTSGSAQLQVVIKDSTASDSESLQNLMRSLEVVGYSSVYIPEPWREPLDKTYIVAQNGNRDNAEAIRATLGFGEVRVQDEGSFDSNITIDSPLTIVLGEDWLEKQNNTNLSY